MKIMYFLNESASYGIFVFTHDKNKVNAFYSPYIFFSLIFYHIISFFTAYIGIFLYFASVSLVRVDVKSHVTEIASNIRNHTKVLCNTYEPLKTTRNLLKSKFATMDSI